MLNIIISGDRNATQSKMLALIIGGLDPKIHRIIQGGCRGIDIIARDIALELGFKVVTIEADWRPNGKYDRSAGPRRNAEMLKQYPPDHVYLFHDDIEHSTGTANMLWLCEKAGVKHTLLSVN